jgi:hypothetical protein
MKQVEDIKTLELIGGIKKKPGRKKLYASDAERVAAYRARKNLVQLNVSLPADVHQALQEYVARQAADGAGLTQNEVIAKLLRSQLLRKR